jgi:hypothetical protein
MNAGLRPKIYVNAKPGAAMTARIADDGTAGWLARSLLLVAGDALPPRDPDDDDEDEDDEEDEDGEEEPPVVREPDE